MNIAFAMGMDYTNIRLAARMATGGFLLFLWSADAFLHALRVAALVLPTENTILPIRPFLSGASACVANSGA